MDPLMSENFVSLYCHSRLTALQRKDSKSVLCTARIWFINFTLSGTNISPKGMRQKLQKITFSHPYLAWFFLHILNSQGSELVMWQTKQLMHIWINSLDNNSEYYINRLVYVLELPKAKFSLPMLLQGRSWEEPPLHLLLESRVLNMAFSALLNSLDNIFW